MRSWTRGYAAHIHDRLVALDREAIDTVATDRVGTQLALASDRERARRAIVESDPSLAQVPASASDPMIVTNDELSASRAGRLAAMSRRARSPEEKVCDGVRMRLSIRGGGDLRRSSRCGAEPSVST